MKKEIVNIIINNLEKNNIRNYGDLKKSLPSYVLDTNINLSYFKDIPFDILNKRIKNILIELKELSLILKQSDVDYRFNEYIYLLKIVFEESFLSYKIKKRIIQNIDFDRIMLFHEKQKLAIDEIKKEDYYFYSRKKKDLKNLEVDKLKDLLSILKANKDIEYLENIEKIKIYK